MSRLILFVFLLFVFNPNSEARFMPDNGLHLQEQLTPSTITEDQFRSLIINFSDIYGDISANFKYSLILIDSWENNQVNAMTWRDGDAMFIEVYGGLARRLSVDAINMVLCHEMGHQVGGWPLYTGDSWASIEGQSDYYSAHVCAKKIFKSINFFDQSKHFLATGQEDACDQRYSDYADRDICYRTMSASLELAELLSLLSTENKRPDFNTPDRTKVKRIRESHPKAQCRLDTYRAGALCPSRWRDTYIPRTEKMSARYLCTPNKKSWKDASRPRCWFVSGK